jgi:tRNA A-37 threonylcarbamoyl transferase component Bud32
LIDLLAASTEQYHRATLSASLFQPWLGIVSAPAKIYQTNACEDDLARIWCVFMADSPNTIDIFVSPPSIAEKVGYYICIIEHQNKPYSITWNGTAKQPDITQLSTRLDWKCRPVDLGLEMSDIWSDSMFVNYGADAILRCSHLSPYPIIKLAHDGEEFRLRVQHEFEIIQDMSRNAMSLPIPKVDGQPLLDDQGIFGYRLEYLFCLEKNELLRRLPEVREAVQQLHEAGFSHGDLSQSNIMKKKEGAIVLIDFGYAGKIGTQVPLSVPQWVYEDGIVAIDADQQALERLSELSERI